MRETCLAKSIGALVFLFGLQLCMASPVLAEAGSDGRQRIPLPPESGNPSRNMGIELFDAEPTVNRTIGSRTLIKLDASYNQALSLRDALLIMLKYNLPIRIARENWNYQKYQLLAGLAGFVPTYSLQYSLNQTHVQPDTNAHSLLFVSQVRYPVFQGGGVVYGVLSQYYRNLAWKRACQGTINDKLLEVFKLYNDVCLQEALLRVEQKSVQISQEVLNINLAMYEAGTGTQYGVMQARSQLFSARERLAQQEGSRRQAALSLAYALNLPLSGDLIPNVQRLQTASIIRQNLGAEECVDHALKNRSELRQYELFRMAAARSVQSSAATLYPQVSFFTSYTRAKVTVNPSQNGNLLNGVASSQVAAAQESQGGVVTNTALNQTASVSPEKKNTGTEGANTFATVVAGGGGTPLANVQGGSLVTSGAVAPIFGASSVTGRPTSSNVSGANTASAGVFPGSSSNFQKGFNLSWSLTNLGIGNLGDIMSACSLTKQALLQANQELQLIISQVRSAYVQLIWSEKKLDSTAFTTESSRETLRYAVKRLRAGVGSSLETVYARKDYTAALRAEARAIADFNQAQAQLLHATGLISVDALTEGQK